MLCSIARRNFYLYHLSFISVGDQLGTVLISCVFMPSGKWFCKDDHIEHMKVVKLAVMLHCTDHHLTVIST